MKQKDKTINRSDTKQYNSFYAIKFYFFVLCNRNLTIVTTDYKENYFLFSQTYNTVFCYAIDHNLFTEKYFFFCLLQ